MTELVRSVEGIEERAEKWLEAFFGAIAAGDDVTSMLDPAASWRDLVALSGEVRTMASAAEISAELRSFRASWRAEPRLIRIVSVDLNERSIRPAHEVIFDFQAPLGKAEGVVRLVQDGEELRAWTLFSGLAELDPGIARPRESRPSEAAYEGEERRNWLDFRTLEASFEERDPEVLVVGAGQCGLALAARLGLAGVDTLVVDRHDRVGDNWRKRYHVLRLHNEKGSNHLPFMPFPDSWPTYIPKDKLADWLEAYASAMELNVWTSTSVVSATFDPEAACWDVRLNQGGHTRTLRPRHLVMAIGVSGAPRNPSIPGLEDFAGDLIHSSDYVKGAEYRGKRALVIGSGVSGHDIAQDLYWHGADVAMMQRSKTIVASLKPGAEMVYSHYRSDLPLSRLDLLNVSVPFPIKRNKAQRLTSEIARLDEQLIQDLNAAGFRTHTGVDGTGFQMQFLRSGGGYYIDVGCSQLIAKGEVGVIDAAEMARIVPGGIELTDGSTVDYDVIVLATGYQSVSDVVTEMLGSDVAGALGPIWGLDDQGELRNICRPTPQPNLWFIAGGLAEARIYSKYLALQLEVALADSTAR